MILLTGVAGFIGMHLARRLLAEGHEVVGVDHLGPCTAPIAAPGLKERRLAALDDPPGFRFHRLDVSEGGALEELFRAHRFDRVIHLAAQTGVRHSSAHPVECVTGNLVGLARVLECSRRHGVGHVLYASSSSAYGVSRRLPFDEHDPASHPVSVYAATKRGGELLAHSYSHLYGLPTTGLRFFTVYGPWGRPDMAPMLFASAIAAGRPIEVYDGGRMLRDFTYIDDVVEAVLRLAARPAEPDPAFDALHPDPAASPAPFRIYNIGNQQPVLLSDFIDALEAALRLPSALAACAWIAAVLAFARRFLGRETGYAAAFIAAGSAGVTVIGRAAIADALLNLFLALSMFDIIRHAEDLRLARRRRVFLWIGLGLLTKGPVALLVPGGASLPAFALQGRVAEWWRAVRDPAGWAILLTVAMPWYVLEYGRRGDPFLAGFFLRHNVERFLAPLQGHGGGPLYYLPAILVLLLPYTGLFLRTLPGLRRMRAAPLDTFLWCWFLFVLLFFSLAGTKLPHYLLYGTTPLLILVARQRHALRSTLLAFAPPLLFLGLLAALPRLLAYAAPHIRNAYVREALGRTEVFGPAWQAAALALLAAVFGLALWRGTTPWPRLAASGLVCSLAMASLLLPALAELQQGPVKEAALLARRAGWDVRSWRINVPSFSVYREAVTPAAAQPQQLPGAGQVVLTRSDAVAALGPVELLYHKGGIVLARMPQ